MSLLEISDLKVEFEINGKFIPVVEDINFSVNQSEILAIVGESGCGKSVTCLSIARLLPEHQARISNGRILLHNEDGAVDILSLPLRKLNKIRGGEIAYIFQEPAASLNPVFKINYQIAEAIMLHRPEVSDIDTEIIKLLKQVRISAPERCADAYPHQLSGGMQQRVMIAMALACKPKLLVADEPTTALDVTIQAQILELLITLRNETGMSIILVTHNLGIVAETAERVIVMYAGNIVEEANTKSLLNKPIHPYTKALLKSVPELGRTNKKLETIPGTVPPPEKFPIGCRFCDRCEKRIRLTKQEKYKCMASRPALLPSPHSQKHKYRCFFPDLSD